MEQNTIQTIDEYITQFPPEAQEMMLALRKVIKECAPEAGEKISWQMPTFTLHGNLVHFATFKKHIGFYPGPSAIEAFGQQLSEYKTSKGAVQFPIGKPMPLETISRMVQFRVDENTKNAETKKKK